jgi:single-stranded-DNA-specific exonuclease
MARALGTHPVVAGLLCARGIGDVEAGRRFLSPGLETLHDPFLLPDMDLAAARIVQAIERRETVMVHGDYDVDGVTSTALMVRFLSKCGADVQYFIPHRQINQYGLNAGAITSAAEAGASLVLALDCGVTALEAVATGRQLGLDVVVIDHHEPGERLPDATAVVDPKRHDSQYPERDLATVGLAFKTASAVCQLMDLPQESLQRAFLDLVAMGTIADVVPLLGENRTLTLHGLRLLPQTRKVGLRILLQSCNVTGRVRASDIAFRVAPRINAVGRMGDATEALELLLTEDEGEATRLALHLETANRERQRKQETAYREALGMLDREADLERDRVLVLASPDWHVGVVGIVASKLLERHGRPCVLLVEEGDEARGSARSVGRFDIASALGACSDTLIRYGGHALAAGLAVRLEDLDTFRQRLNGLAAEVLVEADLVPRLRVDAELLLDEIDGELLEDLERMEPFGQCNPAPVFVTRNCDVLDVRGVGREGTHLKMYVSQGERPIECIGFGMVPEVPWLEPGRAVDLCYSPEINEYNGTRGVQLRLEAVRPAER